MSGRKAIGLMVVILVVFWVIVGTFTFSQSWRQNERLLAAGLRSPRGLAWVPEELVVVAEAGHAADHRPGDRGTSQIATGRLTWISAKGNSRGTLIDGLPGQHVGLLDETLGPAAVALRPTGGLYLLTGQCEAPLCSALLLRDESGALRKVADVRGAAGLPDGESNPWGLAVAPDGLVYLTDAAANALLRVDPRAGPATVAVHARLGDNTVPTGLALGPDGALYVALFTPLPHSAATGAVVRVGPDGAAVPVVTGLTMPIAVAFDEEARLLVLELADRYDVANGYRAHSGRVLRVDPRQPTDRQTLTSGLDYPTALAVAPDGRLYVSSGGAFRGANGQVLQIRRVGPQPTRRAF